MASNSTSEISDDVSHLRAHYRENFPTGVFEIEEEESPSPSPSDINHMKTHLSTITEDAAADGWLPAAFLELERERAEDGFVYVAVRRPSADHDQTTTAALTWALKNEVKPSLIVRLVHVFRVVKHIPTPLGNLPIRQVNPEQREIYMAQEAIKRREFLHKFLKICYDYQVKAETILIESDAEAEAILNHIPILNMRTLVLGANKSDVRRTRSRKCNGVVDQIVQGAPEFCEVKVICDGKDVSRVMESSYSFSSPQSTTDLAQRFGRGKEEQRRLDSAGCGCFKL